LWRRAGGACGAAPLADERGALDGSPWGCTVTMNHTALHAASNTACRAAMAKARASARPAGCGLDKASLATVMCHGSTLLNAGTRASGGADAGRAALFWAPAGFRCDAARLASLNAAWASQCAAPPPGPPGCRPWCSGDRGDNMMFAGRWNEVHAGAPPATLPGVLKIPCCGWDTRTDNDPECGVHRMPKTDTGQSRDPPPPDCHCVRVCSAARRTARTLALVCTCAATRGDARVFKLTAPPGTPSVTKCLGLLGSNACAQHASRHATFIVHVRGDLKP